MPEPTLDQLEGKVRFAEEGREVTLRLIGRTVKRLQEALGAETLDKLLEEASVMPPETLEMFYWAAALWERPDLTREEVAEMHLPYQPTLRAVHDVLALYFYGPPRFGDEEEEERSDADDPLEAGGVGTAH